MKDTNLEGKKCEKCSESEQIFMSYFMQIWMIYTVKMKYQSCVEFVTQESFETGNSAPDTTVNKYITYFAGSSIDYSTTVRHRKMRACPDDQQS